MKKFRAQEGEQSKKLSIKLALRTSILYVIVAGLWIVLSDRILQPFTSILETYAYWQTIKGLLFVVATGTLLFFSMRAQLREIQRTEAEKAAVETHFSKLLAVSTDAVISIDAEQLITYFNRGAETIFGYSPDEILGESLDVLVPARIVEQHRQQIKQFAESDLDSVSMRSVIALRKNREEFVAEATVTKYKEEGGNVFTVILRDINERENAERTIRRHLARTNALIEIAARINANLDLQDVLDAICEEMAKALDVGIVLVVLFDQGRNTIDLATAYGLPEKYADIIKSMPVEKYMENVSKFNPVAFLPDLVEASDVFDLDIVQELGVHSGAVANMFEKNQFFGSLIILSRDGTRVFTENDTSLMKGLADQASAAIKNASLYSDAKKRLENLHALRVIDTAIASSLDLRHILQILVEQAMSRLSVDAVCVYLLNETTLMLEYHTSQGIDLSNFSRADIRLGEGVAGRVALEQRTIGVENLAQDGAWDRPMILNVDLNVYCGAPMIAKGKTRGVLEVYGREKQYEDPEWLELLETLAGQAAIAIETTKLFSDLRQANYGLKLTYDTTLEGWSRALDLRDKETEGHTQRVTELTLKLADMLGITDEDLVHIRRGALLHDIGKLGVPDHILLKEGELDDSEWQEMRQHPVHAYNLLYPIAYLRPALDIPFSHHEHWDGNGYPKGLKGGQIPFAARIFAVVDVWDALTSDRPYRKAWSQQKALRYIRERSGTQFDPSVVDAFLLLIEEGNYPHLRLPE